MELLFSQFSGLNILKDILTPFLAALIGYWLAANKFKKEHIWQEKYSAYQEILSAMESMAYWADEACNETKMLPSIGWFDGKSSHEFYAQARRQIKKHVKIGRVLVSLDALATLEQFENEIFQENYRADEDRLYDNTPLEIDEGFSIHAAMVRDITLKYLLKFTEFARTDLA